jgi:hypothetical protein
MKAAHKHKGTDTGLGYTSVCVMAALAFKQKNSDIYEAEIADLHNKLLYPLSLALLLYLSAAHTVSALCIMFKSLHICTQRTPLQLCHVFSLNHAHSTTYNTIKLTH